MSLLYLAVHVCIGLAILVLELFNRWMIQTYQIHIRTCPDIFYIEFRKSNRRQSVNWFENQLNNLVESFYSINDQCSNQELKFDFQPICFYLRYVWLSISSLYLCLALKRDMEFRFIKSKRI